MAATHEVEIEKTDEINAIDLIYDDFESTEVELMDIDWNDLEGIDENLLPEIDITFVNDETVTVIVEENPSSSLQCKHCKKKFKREKYLTKHEEKCGSTKNQKQNDVQVLPQIFKDNSAKNGVLAISEEDIKSKAAGIISHGLEKIINDPIYSIQIGCTLTFGNVLRQIAVMLHENSEKQSFKELATSLVIRIYKILNKTPNLLTEQNLQTVMSNLHKLTLNEAEKNKWNTILGDVVKKPEFSSLFQKLCTNTMQKIMEIENSQLFKTEDKLQENHLSKQEQEVVRYVAGYLVYSLQKKYLKLSKSSVQSTRVASTAVVQFLNNLKTTMESNASVDSFLDYTKKWTEIRNRGGLITVNDDMFLFVRLIENTVRNILTLSFLKYYRGEDLRDVIYDKLKDSELVTLYWEKLCRNIDNEKLKELLRNQFINKWIDIRARAYVNAYLQIVKRVNNKQSEKLKLSKIAEPALRKTIN